MDLQQACQYFQRPAPRLCRSNYRQGPDQQKRLDLGTVSSAKAISRLRKVHAVTHTLGSFPQFERDSIALLGPHSSHIQIKLGTWHGLERSATRNGKENDGLNLMLFFLGQGDLLEADERVVVKAVDENEMTTEIFFQGGSYRFIYEVVAVGD